jgi:hypothetical protein
LQSRIGELSDGRSGARRQLFGLEPTAPRRPQARAALSDALVVVAARRA